MRKLVLFVAVAILLFAPRLEPQGRMDVITLGTTALSIGMPREAVQRALSERYSLKPSSGPVAKTGPVESMLVWDGKTPIGNVAFREGRLLSVFRYWDPSDQQKGVDYAQKLYAAVSALVADGHRACMLDTAHSDDPQSEQRVAVVKCGRRSLEISILRSDQHGAFASLTEKLQ